MKSSSTDLALQAFNARPTRLEALSDLSRHFRERGMNEVAAMFARRVSIIPPSEDLLFVETWKRTDALEDLSISGYYSVDAETRHEAGEAAEKLALDRNVSRETRDLARNTLFWHAPKLIELAPSWRARQIEFIPPRGWRAMNPSVVRYREKTMAIVRCVNYWIKSDGGYTFPDSEPAISTRNFLVELAPALDIARDAVEITPDLGPVLYGGVLGLEDLRLFTWHDELRFIACARQMNGYGRVEQVTGRLSLDGTVYEMEVIRQPWVGPAEKNWMPIIGAEDRFAEPHFVYRCDPMSVVSASLQSAPEGRSAPVAADNFSGSSQLIPFDDGWLCMTHEPLASPINGRRLNQQRFVQFNSDLEMRGLSRRFHFQLNEEIEYVVGLSRHPDEDKLVVSYGSHDRQAWIGTLDVDDVRHMLRAVADVDKKPGVTDSVASQLAQRNAKLTTICQHARRDRLALDRSASSEERKRARRELHADIKPIGEVFPSWEGRRLNIAPPEGYAARAPSVLRQGHRILASVRCMNYAPKDDCGYHRIEDGAAMGGVVRPQSRNLMIEIDPNTLDASVLGEIIPPDFPDPLPGAPALGLEDIRLFEWEGGTWGIAAFAEQSHDGLSEQWVVRIGNDLKTYVPLHVAPQGIGRRPEKNWMPLAGVAEPRFVYLCDPTIVVDIKGNIVAQSVPELAAEHFHGGSQAIPFDGGWLAAVHWQTVFNEENRWVDFEYRNRFVWLDAEYKLKRVSAPWQFPIAPGVPRFPSNFQFVLGLCWHPDGKRLVMGFDLHEREPWVGTVEADEVRKTLHGGGPKMGRFDDERWVSEQTNRALRDITVADRASRSLASACLPSHDGGCRLKDWDTYLAVRHCLEKCTPDETVLDIGGDRYSSFLRAMAALGYRDLLNINIDEPRPGREGSIEYRHGNAEALDLESHSVRFALCQSVIEHGVDWRKFYAEMARVLVPGGHLFVSTDFWEVPVGPEIFTPADIQEMIVHAGKLGLELVGTLDERCRDACVEWGGRRYTFLNLLLRNGTLERNETASSRFPYVARDRRLGGVKFDLWINDPLDEAWYGKEETIEPDKLWCLEHIRPGMTVVDCGAHHGQTTVAFAKAASTSGHVIAFEALASNAEIIRKNLSLNECENVEVHAHGLGCSEGESNFAHNGGNGTRSDAGEQVRVLPLDYVLSGRSVDFIKIDVEGCELEVLHGAIDIIRRHRPILDIEVHNALVAEPGANIDGILAILSPYDYLYSSPGWNGEDPIKKHLLDSGAHLFCDPRP